MVQRTRLRGTPLTAAEIREIHDHAAKQQEATGAVNKSKLQREISFKVERETIREALAMPRPDADAEPVHELRTEPPKPEPSPDPIASDRERIGQRRELAELKGKYKDALHQLTEAEAQRDALIAAAGSGCSIPKIGR